MNIKELIESCKDKFTGKCIDEEQAQKLREKFSGVDYVEDWIKLQEGLNLIYQVFELPPEKDQSGFGTNMEVLNGDEQIQEAFDFYPGIAAVKNGYLPFANCLNGSGDPYFINYNSDSFNIYRIPHHAVLEDNTIDEKEIELIISFEDLLKS